MKKKKESDNKKAFFIQRLGAFIIDIMIIAFLSSLISSPFIDNKKNEELQKDAIEIVEKMQNSEITFDKYITEYSVIMYKIARESGIVSLISLFLNVLYFVLFQVYNRGQTIGKRLMKIRVVSLNGELSTDQMIIRSLISDFILVDIITFVLMLFVPKNVYFYCVGFFEVIQYLIVIISIFMIIRREDGCAIHDLLARTKVIRV